jgi:small subunit ribosomal protein S17
MENNKKTTQEEKVNCTDKQCPFHGELKARGRSFKGFVVSKNNRRIAIEFERIVYIKKYERQMKKRTKLHARLPECMRQDINIGDYIEIMECRPLSKILHFVVMKKINNTEDKK